MSKAPFSHWPHIYMESVGYLSKDTWQKGVLFEIEKRGIRDWSRSRPWWRDGVGSDLLQSLGVFEITALDMSPAMLDLNRTATKKVVGDFLQLKDLPDKYDLIVSGFDSLNYLDQKCLPELFKGISAILRANGLVIFDYSSPKFLSVDWSDAKFSQDVAGGRLDWKTKFNPDDNRCDLELAYSTGEKQQWVEAHSQYTINAYQMHDALDDTELSIEYVRNLNSETFSPQANTHVYVIRKV